MSTDEPTEIARMINGRKCYLAHIENSGEGIWADKLGWFDCETEAFVTEAWFGGFSFDVQGSTVITEDIQFDSVRVLEEEDKDE